MIKKEIESLIKVQELDSEIFQCQEQIREIPEELSQIDAEVDKERKTLRQLEQDLKAIQLRQKEKEAALQDKESHIKKFESQLSQVKTNKEYSSLQTEIKSLQADNSLLEDSIIQLFDEIETCQQKLKAEQARLISVENEAKSKKATFEQKMNDLKKRSAELINQKQETIKAVNPEIAGLYERIVQNKKGLALVKVDGEVCSACQLHLRPQQLSEIQLAEAIVLCEQCSRILYFE